MRLLDDILNRARAARRHIVLCEGSDPRIVEGSAMAARQGVADVTLLGHPDAVTARLEQIGAAVGDGLRIVDPERAPHLDTLAALYHDLRRAKGVTADEARQAAAVPHIHAALMVRAGMADGTLGGAVLPTAQIVRAALQVIGPAPGAGLVSSCFLMLLNDQGSGSERALVFSDAGLVIDPDAGQLAQIALDAALSFQRLCGAAPRVAMLSFSTHGSASHPASDKVATATRLARDRAADVMPGLIIDGELQFDAAFLPDVARAKAPQSPIAGDANVFVFPNLDAGNIGYKIAQRLGGATAIGPILQGLAQPANDLSRGCVAHDVLAMIAVTALQSIPTTQAPQPIREGVA